MTVRSIIQKLKLPRKSVGKCPLLMLCEKPRPIPCIYVITSIDSSIFNAKKSHLIRSGIVMRSVSSLSDMNLHMYSMKKTIRRNLCTDHLTAHLTISASGNIMPLYLIFPGEGIADIPESVSSSSETWSNWSPNGWMDEERFQAYMLLYI